MSFRANFRTCFFGLAKYSRQTVGLEFGQSGGDASLISSQNREFENLDQLLKEVGFFFPAYGTVSPEIRVRQSNAHGLILDASLTSDLEVPDNRVRPCVTFSVTLFEVDKPITDDVWSQVVISLRQRYKVQVEQAPSEIMWSEGILGGGRQVVESDPAAIALVRGFVRESRE